MTSWNLLYDTADRQLFYCGGNIFLLLQIAKGDNGKPASLNTLSLVPLVERQQCDGCASCITDVHRTCSECGYDACIRCCRGLREQGQVSGFQDITCLL